MHLRARAREESCSERRKLRLERLISAFHNWLTFRNVGMTGERQREMDARLRRRPLSNDGR